MTTSLEKVLDQIKPTVFEWIQRSPSLLSHNHTTVAADGGILTDDEHDGFSEYTEIAAPSAPSSDKVRVYARDDSGTSKLYYKRSDNTETELGGGAGGPHELLSLVHTDTLADTVLRGDLIVGNSTPAWARLAKGDQCKVLMMGADDPAWEPLPVLADHDHSGDAGDGGQFDAANLESGAATDEDVLLADGAGAADWGAIPDRHPAWSIEPFGALAGIMSLHGATQVADLFDEGANTFLGGPVSGANSPPTFRALDALDLPAHTHTRPRTIMFSWTGTLATAVGLLRAFPDGNWVIGKVWIAVNTAPTGAAIIVDIHMNGVTIFTDQGKRPSIAAGDNSDESDTPDVTAITKADYVTMDIDQVGSTIAGQDLTVHVRATETA